MIRHNFSGRLNAAEQERLNTLGLSNDEIQRVAPSAFAVQSHADMSSKYTFVPTSAIIDGMRQNGFLPVKAQQSLARREDKQPFTKHMIRFRQQGASLNQVGDSILETVLTNSHDGSSAYKLTLGVFRLACTNGLLVAEGMIRSVIIRHVGNIIHNVIDSSYGLLKEAPKVAETINTWRQIGLDQQEQLLLATQAHDLRYDKGTPLYEAIAPVKLLEARRYDDRGDDLWHVFNRIQENAIRGQQGEVFAGRRRTSTEIKGIDHNVSLNRNLWAITEHFAAKKQGLPSPYDQEVNA